MEQRCDLELFSQTRTFSRKTFTVRKSEHSHGVREGFVENETRPAITGEYYYTNMATAPSLTLKRFYHKIFGYSIVVRMVFDVQLIADGKFVFQVLHGSDAAQAAVHHDGQTGAQSFAFFEAVESKNEINM
jgi:hypothetical protein